MNSLIPPSAVQDDSDAPRDVEDAVPVVVATTHPEVQKVPVTLLVSSPAPDTTTAAGPIEDAVAPARTELLTVPGTPVVIPETAVSVPAGEPMTSLELEEPEYRDSKSLYRKGSRLQEFSTIIRDTSRLAAPPKIDSKTLPIYTRWMNNSTVKKVLFLIPLGSGAMIVLYSTIGTQTGESLGGGIWGTFIAYAGAIILTLVLSFCIKRPWNIYHLMEELQLDKLNYFSLTGGIIGVCYSVASMYIPKIIGFGPFFVFGIVGQVLSSLFIDMFGICWSPATKLGCLFLIGEILVIVGAIIFEFQAFLNFSDPPEDSSVSYSPAMRIGCLLITIVVGSCEVFQSGANSRLAFLVGSTMRVTFWSFSSGMVPLAIASVSIVPHPTFQNILTKDTWWQWMGGPVAVIGLLCNTVMPKFLGFAVTFCWFIAGQLVTSVVFDNFGVLGSAVVPADAYRISGVLVVALGVVTLQVAKLWSPIESTSGVFVTEGIPPSGMWLTVSNIPESEVSDYPMDMELSSISFAPSRSKLQSMKSRRTSMGDPSQYQKPLFMPSL